MLKTIKQAITRPPRVQYAALPWRASAGHVEYLLITSRESRRWIIPKGWPQKGLKPWETAAQEAYEEAGIRGSIEQKPLGRYDYDKKLDGGLVVRCRATVFVLLFETQHYSFPEAGMRKMRWMGAGEAAAAVEEPGLRRIIALHARTLAGGPQL